MKNHTTTESCCAASRNHTNKSVKPPSKRNSKIVPSLKQDERKEMVYLSGGKFLMGTMEKVGFPTDGEGPIRNIMVNPFYIDTHTVTNQTFQRFIDDTGYRTEAEQYGWSFVFFN